MQRSKHCRLFIADAWIGPVVASKRRNSTLTPVLDAANAVVHRLLLRSRTLAADGPPLLGRQLPEYPDADLRELLERPYRMIFEVTSRRIEIVTVMHYRQLLPEASRYLRGS